MTREVSFASVRLEPPITALTWSVPAEVPVGGLAVSFEGRYAAYQQGDGLVVADLAAGKVWRTIGLTGRQVSLLQWLPDRDRLLYATGRRDGTGDLELSVVDVESGQTSLIHRVVRHTAASRISACSLSSLTNLAFLVVEDGPGLRRLYRLDVMGNLYRQRLPFAPGRIAVLLHEDRVIVEEAGTGRVWAVSGVLGTERVAVEPGRYGKAVALIGVDGQDHVYLGEVAEDGRTVVAVRRGEVGKAFQEVWRDSAGVPREGLLVGRNDAVYSVDAARGLATALTGDRRVRRFQGELAAFDGHLLAVKDGGRLTVESAL